MDTSSGHRGPSNPPGPSDAASERVPPIGDGRIQDSRSASATERARRSADLHEWLAEWRWWLGTAVILSAVWGVRAVRSGPDFFWPLVPLGVWAAVLVAVAIWPRAKAADDQS